MCTDINKMSKWKVSQCFFLLLCNKLPQIQQFITTPIYYFMLLWVRSTGGLSWCSVQSHNFIVVLARLGSELETLGKSFPPGSFRLLSSQKIINKDTEKTRSSSHRRPIREQISNIYPQKVTKWSAEHKSKFSVIAPTCRDQLIGYN